MLHVQNLSLTFPGAESHTLQDVTFTLEPGEFCVLLGSNGCGKSTLLRTLMGDLTPDAGDIVLNGQSLLPLPLHARAAWISTVSQDVGIGTAGSLTLLENLALGNMRGRPAPWGFYAGQRAALRAAVAALHLDLPEDALDRPLSSFSGGQRQRMALAIAILRAPALLLLDEHASALDPRIQKEVMATTAAWVAQQNLTTIMITHHLTDALQYGTRLLMMAAGRIILDVRGAEKSALTLDTLKALFYREIQ